jgi:hypothetical protein
LVLLGLAEFVSRLLWAEQQESECYGPSGVDGHGHANVSCTATGKNAEGPWTTYRYNECGYRSETSCGPKPKGSVRIAIIGSSVSLGLFVPYEQTYFARAAEAISRDCAVPVDVQNMGAPGTNLLFAYGRMEEALALKPDVIVYLLAPWDVEQQVDPQALTQRDEPNHRIIPAPEVTRPSLMRQMQLLLIQSRTVLVAQHFLFQNRESFLRIYLHYGDKADFLRKPFTQAWQHRFADLGLIIGDMATKTRTAGVPFVVVAVPSRAEAALLSSPGLPPNVDPFAFGREIENIAAVHRVEAVDLMTPFSRIPNSERLFYVVDGHVTGEGERVIGDSIAEKLKSIGFGATSRCGPTHPMHGER